MTNINLKITNNTSLDQSVSILGGFQNQSIANIRNTLYSFDISSEDFPTISTVKILYYTTESVTIITLEASVIDKTTQGVADALNTLNVGYFSVNGFVINVENSFYIYTELQITNRE